MNKFKGWHEHSEPRKTATEGNAGHLLAAGRTGRAIVWMVGAASAVLVLLSSKGSPAQNAADNSPREEVLHPSPPSAGVSAPAVSSEPPAVTPTDPGVETARHEQSLREAAAHRSVTPSEPAERVGGKESTPDDRASMARARAGAGYGAILGLGTGPAFLAGLSLHLEIVRLGLIGIQLGPWGGLFVGQKTDGDASGWYLGGRGAVSVELGPWFVNATGRLWLSGIGAKSWFQYSGKPSTEGVAGGIGAGIGFSAPRLERLAIGGRVSAAGLEVQYFDDFIAVVLIGSYTYF